MKTLPKVLIGAGILATVAGGAALARGPMGCGPMGGPGGPGPAAMVDRAFGVLDADKDGAVTLAEAMAAAAARFDKVDTSHDGTVDKTEIESWVGRRAPAEAAARFLARHDLDADGKVTKAEYEKPFRKLFALVDRNDDGKVTKDEAAAAPMMAMGGHGRHHGWGMKGNGMGWNQGWGPMNGGPMGGPMGDQMGGPQGGPMGGATQPQAK